MPEILKRSRVRVLESANRMLFEERNAFEEKLKSACQAPARSALTPKGGDRG